jgi:hypothetical protein
MTWLAMCAGFAALGFVLWIQRRCGPRMAGMCVCLPLTSGPLALSVYLASGAEAAQSVVAGSIDAIGGAAVALTAWSAMRRCPMWLSVPATALTFIAVVSVKNLFVMTPMQAVMVAALLIGLCVAISQRISRESVSSAAPREQLNERNNYVLPFAMLALCFALSPIVPTGWSGLLASAPILAMAMLIPLRVGNPNGHGIAQAVQGGYAGMAAKLTFFVVVMAFLDFEGHASIAFAFAALLCFAAGLALWLRNQRAARQALPAMLIPSGLPIRTRVA